VDHLVLDIGGSWIKGALVHGESWPDVPVLKRVRAPESSAALHATLINFARECAAGKNVRSVVISTAGVVHSAGTHVVRCAEHLSFLRAPAWRDKLETALDCPVTMINDAEAFLLGAATLGKVPRIGTLCCLVIGTGLGCALTKDARFWRPHRVVPLLGSIRIGGTSFDALASASALATHEATNDLVICLKAAEFEKVRETYFADLAGIAVTAAILYGADRLLLGGGLCDAAALAELDVATTIRRHWKKLPPELDRWPEIEVVREGNAMQLIGAAALAVGSEAMAHGETPSDYLAMITEQIHPDSADLHARTPREIIEILCRAENEAGQELTESIGVLSEVAAHVIAQWPAGGRIIYVGAGTSGRVAAMDAVEIPCTFGCLPDRVVAVVAGGLMEAALSIEQDGEEDHSAVADLILLQPDSRDTVIGISASGSSFFVRSALFHAQQRGAATVMIRTGERRADDPWKWIVPLRGGREVVAGSTRMKAGTATKKLLNFLTTTVLAKSGKLHGPFMIDMECLNAKLMARAQWILEQLFGLPAEEARIVLARNDFRLKKAIAECEAQRQPSGVL